VHVIYWIAMKAKGSEQSIVNGARQKKEKGNPGRWIRSRRTKPVHYECFLEKTNDALYVISLRCTVHVVQSKLTRWQYDFKLSTIITITTAWRFKKQPLGVLTAWKTLRVGFVIYVSVKNPRRTRISKSVLCFVYGTIFVAFPIHHHSVLFFPGDCLRNISTYNWGRPSDQNTSILRPHKEAEFIDIHHCPPLYHFS
jgi:hypothetical protein